MSTDEQPVITLPPDATEDDVRRVEETAKVVRRDVAIRRQYPDLRDEHGKWEAIALLAERHCCSSRTVRRAIYGSG